MARLESKVAIVVGAGQTPGVDVGNGRATTIRFCQEGARVLAVDRDLDSARESLDMAGVPGLDAVACAADTADTASLKSAVGVALERWGRVDILHYNVGINVAAGPQAIDEIEDATFDRILSVNLRGAIMAVRFVLPIMRAQQAGVITLVSSITALETRTPLVAYRASKAGLLAFMHQLAAQQAPHGIRVNAILPGLMQTAMSITSRMQKEGRSREEIIAERNALVPLRSRGGSGWDVANAAIFLASDEAAFITGASLPVDGGTLSRIGW